MSVHTEHKDKSEELQLSDCISEFPQIFGGVTSLTRKTVEEARRHIGHVVSGCPELRRAMVRISWGPHAAESSDARTSENADADETTCYLAIADLFEGVLEDKGVSPTTLASLAVPAEWVEETVERLRRSIEARHYPRQLTALLNCPAIDLPKACRVFEGKWHEAPFHIEIGYPSDSLCAEVLDMLGYEYIVRDSGLDQINCFVRLSYFTSADMDSQAWAGANWAAEGYLREVVDLLRVVFDGDIGILHVSSGPSRAHEGVLVPPFWDDFRESRHHLPRTPLRRIYDPPPLGTLGVEDMRRIGQLIQRYSMDRVEVAGLPAAMDRLRAVFERYEPGEAGRLVEAMTGLEALFLSASGQELKYRLQLRVARFLEPDPRERLALAKQLSKAYDLRSKVVHTGTLGKMKEAEAEQLQAFTIGLLRRALSALVLTDFAVGKSGDSMEDTWLELVLGDATLPATGPEA